MNSERPEPDALNQPRAVETSADPTVFVVEDDEAVRSSLRWLLESADLKVEGYATAKAFLEDYDPSRGGCLILDVRLPGMTGLELQRELRQHHIDLPVLIITGHGDIAMAVEAMKNGALDFLQKPFDDQELLDHVQNAIRLDTERRQRGVQKQEFADRLARLSPRELQVKDMLVNGLSNKQIASSLGISEKTVEVHRGHLMKKAGAKNIAQLMQLVLKAQATDE